MAEEQAASQEQTQEGAKGPEETTDYQAKYEAMRQHSREWERKAKENQAAAGELEKLKEQQASEQEKANKRAEKAEAELSELKAKAARAEAVAEAADKAGVPTEVVSVLNGEDAAELADQAKRLLKLLPAYPARTDDGGGSAKAEATNAQRFAENLEGII